MQPASCSGALGSIVMVTGCGMLPGGRSTTFWRRSHDCRIAVRVSRGSNQPQARDPSGTVQPILDGDTVVSRPRCRIPAQSLHKVGLHGPKVPGRIAFQLPCGGIIRTCTVNGLARDRDRIGRNDPRRQTRTAQQKLQRLFGGKYAFHLGRIAPPCQGRLVENLKGAGSAERIKRTVQRLNGKIVRHPPRRTDFSVAALSDGRLYRAGSKTHPDADDDGEDAETRLGGRT